MVETKGSVKLFGATIEVAAERGSWEKGKSILNQKPKVKIKGKEQEPTTPRENSEPAASSIEMEHSEAVPLDEGGNSSKKTEEKQDRKLPNPREKLLKKPTKILPCPRCHSLDTKFCYFNNYNVNQPRHFCRACQRYWTDGGAMRNMPIGAGRRKSKNSPSQFRHMTLYGAAGLHSIPSNILEAYGHHPEQSSDKATPSIRNGMMPPHNPKDQSLNIDENIISPKGELEVEEKVRVFPPNIADAVQNSSSARDRIRQEPGGLHGFQDPYLNGSPFPSTWNPPHAFCASYLPVSFYLTPGTSCCSAPPGPEATAMFGKHARDGSILGRNHHVMACDGLYGKSDEKGILLRKTTRIDDPSEASKCYAWDEMREKGTASRESCFQGLFGTFQPKAETVGPKAEMSNVLHANPLALLRSLEFHENIQWRNDTMNASRKG